MTFSLTHTARPRLQSGRLLARNTLFNVAGTATPFILAVVAIPVLVHRLGTDRFGILTLAWMLVGYFSLFDMGIGRATTKFTAEAIAKGAIHEIPSIFWASTIVLGILGFAVMAVSIALTPWLVSSILNIPSTLRTETTESFYLLSLSIPFLLVTLGVRGIMEAQQRFAAINAIRIPASLANYVLPLLVLPFSRSLVPISLLLASSRVLVLFVHLLCLLRSLTPPRRPSFPGAQKLLEFMKFGAWITVSNIVSPAMTYLDRLFIGTFLTIEAVTYYVTPYELVTRTWVLSGSLMMVLFPAFASHATTNRGQVAQLHDRAIAYMLMVYTPIVVVIISLAAPFLSFWLSGDFSSKSTSTMQILSVGVLANAVGGVSFNVVQSLGRADLTAKFHLAELPVYVILILTLVDRFGVTGVAIAWTLRLILDTLIWLWLADRLMGRVHDSFVKRCLPMFVLTGLALSISFGLAATPSLPLRSALVALLLAVIARIAWTRGLTSSERSAIRSLLPFQGTDKNLK